MGDRGLSAEDVASIVDAIDDLVRNGAGVSRTVLWLAHAVLQSGGEHLDRMGKRATVSTQVGRAALIADDSLQLMATRLIDPLLKAMSENLEITVGELEELTELRRELGPVAQRFPL